jgi:hypothetical protein
VRARRVPGLCLLLCWYACVSVISAARPTSIRPQDLLAHLEQVVSWYRHVNSDPSTGNVLIHDSLHQASLKALELAFQFARAEAALIGESATPTPAAQGNLRQVAAQAAARVSSIQSQILQIYTRLHKATERQRQTLLAERNELSAELNLAKEIQTTVQNMVSFTGAIESGGGALETQIAELESSVPEAVAGRNPAPANPPSKESAVESVYAKYRERIERQYGNLEQSVDVPLAEPKPESRLRFIDAGLQFTVRYPVEIQRALEMDDRILRALHDAVSSEPKLNFAPSGAPKLQAA